MWQIGRRGLLRGSSRRGYQGRRRGQWRLRRRRQWSVLLALLASVQAQLLLLSCVPLCARYVLANTQTALRVSCTCQEAKSASCMWIWPREPSCRCGASLALVTASAWMCILKLETFTSERTSLSTKSPALYPALSFRCALDRNVVVVIGSFCSFSVQRISHGDTAGITPPYIAFHFQTTTLSRSSSTSLR